MTGALEMEATPMQEITSSLRFPEGPVAMSDGSVLVTEMARQTLTRVKSSGEIEIVADCGGCPNGAAVGPDAKVYVCNNGGLDWSEVNGRFLPGLPSEDYVRGSIQKVDLDTGEVEDLYVDCDGRPLHSPNDIVFDSVGGFYFTDLGKGRERDVDRGAVYYAKADGSGIREVAFPLDRPNGIGLSPGDRRLYIAETFTGRVWYWDIEAPGQLKKAVGPYRAAGNTLLCGLEGFQLLDSLAVDAEGNVCVATLVTGAITVIAPDGAVRRVVNMPEHDAHVTNICFGGESLQTAYITSSGLGRLYAMEWHCPGLKLHHAAAAS